MRLGGRKKRLTGERVELRRHSPKDYPLYARWYGDEEIWRLTSWAASPMSPPEVRRLFDEREFSKSDESFAIHLSGGGSPIGIISLTNIKRGEGAADLSIIIGPEEDRGQGYGTEAMELLFDYAFERLGLRRISLSVFDFNERAISAYRKLGFSEDGKIPDAVKRSGEAREAILMSLDRKDWEKRRY